MFWQEDENQEYRVPDDIQDVSFRLRGKRLAIDHVWDLSQALLAELPWLAEEESVGIHDIHVAASGNGWMRPENGEHECLYLSRRTRMTLRLPKHRIDDAQALVGRTIKVGADSLEIGETSVKPLSDHTTIFSRYVVVEAGEVTESDFLQRLANLLKAEFGIKIRKMLCGREMRFETPDGPILTRNVMLSDLEKPDSVEVQQRGIGPHRLLGCGLFIPHKGIDPVSTPAQEE